MTRFMPIAGRLALVAALLLSIVGVSLVTGPASQAQASVPASARLVPSDAVLYLSIDTHFLSPQWVQTTALAQRVNPDADARGIAQGALESAFSDEVDLDIAPFVGGEIALAYLSSASLFGDTSTSEIVDDPDAAAQGLIGGVAIVAIPASIRLASAELDSALADFAESRGTTVEEAIYDGVTIQFVGPDLATETPGVAVATIDDALVVAFSPSLLEPIIDLAGGDGDSITTIGGFDESMASMPDDRIIVGLLTGPSLVANGGQVGGVGPAIEAFVPGGANGVTAFAVQSEEDGIRVDTRTVSSDGEPIRTFGNNTQPNLLGQLPAGTQVAVSGNDLAQTRLVDGALAIVFELVFGALQGMFAPLDGSATPEPLPTTFDETVDAAYGLASAFLGIDLQSSLVDLVDGEFLFALWGTGGPASSPSVGFLSETSDPATVDSTISSLSFVAGFVFGAQGEVGTNGMTEFAAGGGAIEMGVSDDMLVIGYGGGGTALLDEPRNALVDTSLYQTTTAPLPDDHSLLIYVNVQSLQAGAGANAPGTFGIGSARNKGPAFAFVMFNDQDEMGGQGYLYIPEP